MNALYGMILGGLSGALAGGAALLFLDRIPDAWLKERWEETLQRKTAGPAGKLFLVLQPALCGGALGAGAAEQGELLRRLLLLLACTILAQAALCDGLYRVLPDQHTAAIALCGLLNLAAGQGEGVSFQSGAADSFALSFAGSAMLSGSLCFGLALLLWLPVLLPKGNAFLGLGDVKLFGALGLLAGNPEAGLQLFFLAFLLHGLFCAAGLLLGKLRLQSEAAMGPAIALAAALVLTA